MQTQYASTQTNQKAILHSFNRSAQNVDFPLRFLFSFCYLMTPNFIAESQLENMNTSEVLVLFGCG